MSTHPDHTAFVCLGSNLGDAESNLALARKGLAALADVRLVCASSVYMTEPQDHADQPWFRNQVVQLWLGARYQPEALLRDLLELEARLGRVRSTDPALRYGPRCIDIDLLLIDALRLETPFCTLPHPRMTRRAFVLEPLAEIAPGLAVAGKPVEAWLARLSYRREGSRIFQ